MMSEVIIVCWLFWGGTQGCEPINVVGECPVYKEKLFFETKAECEEKFNDTR
jgi:hypothetical protein